MSESVLLGSRITKSNGTVAQWIARPADGIQYEIVSISAELFAGAQDDQFAVSSRDEAGDAWHIYKLCANTANAVYYDNAYPCVRLTPGYGIWVAGIVVGEGSFIDASISYRAYSLNRELSDVQQVNRKRVCLEVVPGVCW